MQVRSCCALIIVVYVGGHRVTVIVIKCLPKAGLYPFFLAINLRIPAIDLYLWRSKALSRILR